MVVIFKSSGHHVASRPTLSGEIKSPLKICPGLEASGVAAAATTRGTTAGGSATRDASVGGSMTRDAFAGGGAMRDASVGGGAIGDAEGLCWRRFCNSWRRSANSFCMAS